MSVTLYPWQQLAVDKFTAQSEDARRMCLFFSTGSGKTLTALHMMKAVKQRKVAVIAPPITHAQWADQLEQMGFDYTICSVEKFRQDSYRHPKDFGLIVDEFHLAGGRTGKGFKKLEKVAKVLQQPMIICSATPQYNDAERCWCVLKIIHPEEVRKSYLTWLYEMFILKPNRFSRMPDVTGFQDYPDAEDFLKSFSRVTFLKKEHEYTMIDVDTARGHYDVDNWKLQELLRLYSLNLQKERVVASGMEKRMANMSAHFLNEKMRFREAVYQHLLPHFKDEEKILIFSQSAKIARAFIKRLRKDYPNRVDLITGSTTIKQKTEIVQKFLNEPDQKILVGTASLATGVDGLDAVCDRLLILVDTDDNAKRKQLIGRILPRGSRGTTKRKTVYTYRWC